MSGGKLHTYMDGDKDDDTRQQSLLSECPPIVPIQVYLPYTFVPLLYLAPKYV